MTQLASNPATHSERTFRNLPVVRQSEKRWAFLLTAPPSPAHATAYAPLVHNLLLVRPYKYLSFRVTFFWVPITLLHIIPTRNTSKSNRPDSSPFLLNLVHEDFYYPQTPSQRFHTPTFVNLASKVSGWSEASRTELSYHG
jgi:hypothetical protein